MSVVAQNIYYNKILIFLGECESEMKKMKVKTLGQWWYKVDSLARGWHQREADVSALNGNVSTSGEHEYV